MTVKPAAPKPGMGRGIGRGLTIATPSPRPGPQGDTDDKGTCHSTHNHQIYVANGRTWVHTYMSTPLVPSV